MHFFFFELFVDFFLRWFPILCIFQWVPLSNRSSRWGKHIRPMAKFSARGIATEKNLSDRFRCSNAIVVDHSQHQLYFLEEAIRIIV